MEDAIKLADPGGLAGPLLVLNISEVVCGSVSTRSTRVDCKDVDTHPAAAGSEVNPTVLCCAVVLSDNELSAGR